jgi:tetratricopeptide (TPR) repeat protein
VAAAAVAGWWYLHRESPEWTSSSPRAIEELEAGLEDRSKYYLYDASLHFHRALELDPDFAAARLYLLLSLPEGRERWQELRSGLEEADLGTLRPRERFLIRYYLARMDGRDADAEAVVREFLGEHPRDPFGVNAECILLWSRQEWDEASECYRHLLRLHPNQVEAQNRLGYVAMARGRFSEAEEHFLTYRYVAPDQANPYHSMSELLVLLGRYDEAEAALRKTLEIKDDFCAAYTEWARLEILTGRFDAARGRLRRAAEIPACHYLIENGSLCIVEGWVTYLEERPEEAWQQVSGDCLERHGGFDVLAHRIAVMTGREAEAAAMEEALRARYEKVKAKKQPVYAAHFQAVIAHVEGVRALAAGDLESAAERFRAADEMLSYWIPGLASLKVFNRINLLRTLEALGKEAEATAVRRKIESVNPHLLDQYKIPDLERLKAPR